MGLCLTKPTISPYTSAVYEIFAGPHRKRFFAHSSVLSQSKVLKNLVEGNWKDSLERIIAWEDWDEASVGRLLEWLYTGDYVSPDPVEVEPRYDPINEMQTMEGINLRRNSETSLAIDAITLWDTPAPAEADSLPDNTGASVAIAFSSWGSKSLPKNRKGHRSVTDLTPISSAKYDLPEVPSRKSNGEAFLERYHSSSKDSQTLDWEDPLLTHAKLYVMANCFLLQPLQNMALHRLKATLLLIGKPLSESLTVTNLTALIQYVYAHTDRLRKKEEPLRQLVTTFAATHFTRFKGDDFTQLMCDGGDFVTDLMLKLNQRIVFYESTQKKPKKSDWDKLGPAAG